MIYLHIGRNKVGSTTLQDYFYARRDELAAHGITYAMFGHMREWHPDLPGFASADELAAYARAHPDRSVLVSNEFMFPWPRSYTEAVVAALKGVDAKVIAYIRPYAEWISSNYSWEIHMGVSSLDFDHFFEQIRDGVSCWPALEAWGNGMGWENMHIRSLDPRSLRGGNLISDCLSALGMDSGVEESARQLRSNASPNWMVLELVRSLMDQTKDVAWDDPYFRTHVHPLKELMDQAIAASPNGGMKAQYHTAAQLRFLGELYNRDIGAIGELTGVEFPAIPLDRIEERPFLPSIRMIPKDIMADFAARASAPAFRERWPDAAGIAHIALDAVVLPASTRGWAKIKRFLVPGTVPDEAPSISSAG